MPAVYNTSGLRFDYPESWRIEGSAAGEVEGSEGDRETEYVSVSVQSPEGAFWTVVKYPGAEDPRRHLEAALAAMREEYDSLDVEPAQEVVAGHKLTGYDLNFFCLDVTNTAHLRGLSTRDATLVILCQADDREWGAVEPVFRAISSSLLAHLPRR